MNDIYTLTIINNPISSMENNVEFRGSKPNPDRPKSKGVELVSYVSNTYDDLSNGHNGTINNGFQYGDETIAEYTVTEAIEKIGVGRFQIFSCLLAGFSNVGDAMQAMVVAIIGPILVCEWGISTTEVAAISVVSLAGAGIGAPIYGFVADRIGRRNTMVISSAFVVLFGVLSPAVDKEGVGVYWMIAMRFLVSFNLGGGAQAPTYVSELLPKDFRGKGISLLMVCFALGAFIEVALAMAILLPFPSAKYANAWKYWLIASSFPSLVFCIAAYWLPKSPHFEAINGRMDSAQAILEKSARWNKVELPKWKLVAFAEETPRGVFSDLWKPGMALTTALLAVIWFVLNMNYYGITLASTEIIKVGNTCNYTAFGNDDNNTCIPLDQDKYLQLLWISIAELPGLVLTGILVDIPKLGRKGTLVLLSAVFGALMFCLFICMSSVMTTFVLFCARAIANACLTAMYVYSPEAYPTEVRALALGMGNMVGKVGATCTPVIAQILIEFSLYYPVTIYAGLAIIASVVAIFLPETLGKDIK